MNNGWEQIKQYLESRMTSEAYRNWISRTEYAGLEGTTLKVYVPDEYSKQWLQDEYGETIRAAVLDLNLPVRLIQYEIGTRAIHVNGNSNAAATAPVAFASPTTQLNPRFSFDNFVVGSSNQFAHAAAQAVANSPSKAYNPLFIYGGVGVGKTHLLHAIAHSVLGNYPSMKVVYTTGERFLNEMVACLKNDRMGLFHQQYRTADVLLVDDVQIIAGKDRTQDEFFHTFNELYEHQKQIVITSDSAPKNMPGLVERLRSRFEWGLLIDIQPPDLETKMAILDKKAEADGIDLPEDVRIYIARSTKSNVRELEGALIKLIAYSSVTGHKITVSMAQQILKHLGQGGDRRVHVDTILRKVADQYGLQPAQLKHKTNARNIAFPRQIAMYVVKELMQSSLPEIGKMFGGKHHTTVLHSIAKIEKLRNKDPEFNKILHNLIDSIH